MRLFLWPVLTIILGSALTSVAATYTFHTIDVPFPGAESTVVTGHQQQRFIGAYRDAAQNTHGFVRTRGGRFLTLLNVTPQDASAAGITGWFLAPGSRPDGGVITRGFVFHEGTFQDLQVARIDGPRTPPTTLTEALAINDGGVVVGDFRSGVDGKFRGFLWDPATGEYTTIEGPDAESTDGAGHFPHRTGPRPGLRHGRCPLLFLGGRHLHGDRYFRPGRPSRRGPRGVHRQWAVRR